MSSLSSLSSALPGLLPLTTRHESRCKICGDAADLMDVVDFGKYCSPTDPYAFGLTGVPVYYSICRSCQFVFTEFFDTWDSAMFGRHVYNDDYIKIDGGYAGARPAYQAKGLAALFGENKDVSVLDYGSGSGLTAQYLGELGYRSIACYDPFSQPVRPERRFDVVISMAVVEHSPRPVDTFRDMASFLTEGGIILCKTGIMDIEERRQRGNWWYIGPRNGHASIFTRKAMEAMGRRIGLSYHVMDGLHCFCPERVNTVAAAVLRGPLHRFEYLQLEAPSDLAAPSWSAPPREAATPFRWTTTERVRWPLPESTAVGRYLYLEIPYVSEIRPDFAAQCRVRVDGRYHPLTKEAKREGSVLSAQLRVDGSVRHVELVTPEPEQPHRGRSGDKRKLGLAVRAAA